MYWTKILPQMVKLGHADLYYTCFTCFTCDTCNTCIRATSLLVRHVGETRAGSPQRHNSHNLHNYFKSLLLTTISLFTFLFLLIFAICLVFCFVYISCTVQFSLHVSATFLLILIFYRRKLSTLFKS